MTTREHTLELGRHWKSHGAETFPFGRKREWIWSVGDRTSPDAAPNAATPHANTRMNTDIDEPLAPGENPVEPTTGD